MNRRAVLLRARPIFELYKTKGDKKYMISENITQTQHAIQAWRWMRRHPDSTPQKRISALFHDVGHLLYKTPIDPGVDKINDFHEYIGAEFLRAKGFREEVWRPIQLHVDAKRYLVTEYDYPLSDASKITLELQGGKMTDSERKRFIDTPFGWDAISLRMCDDKSKNMSHEELDSSEIDQILYDIGRSLKS